MARLHTNRLTKLQALRKEFPLKHYHQDDLYDCYKDIPPVMLTPANDVEARLWYNALTEMLSRSKTFDRFLTPEAYELLRQLARGINHSLKQKYER